MVYAGVRPELFLPFFEQTGISLESLTCNGFATILYIAAMSCPKLKSIRIKDVNEDSALATILTKAQLSIQSLEIRNCTGNINNSLKDSNFPSLRSVNVDGGIDDAALASILQRSPSLIKLSIAGLPVASLTLSAAATVTGLRHVSLNEVKGISADDLTVAMSAWKLLEVADFQSMRTLTDQCLTTLATRNPNLRAVRLSHCTSVSRIGLGAIAEHCGERLQCLAIVQCSLITAEDLAHVMGLCPGVNRLAFSQKIAYHLTDLNLDTAVNFVSLLQNVTQLHYLDVSINDWIFELPDAMAACLLNLACT
jgi:hypothetical protein